MGDKDSKWSTPLVPASSATYAVHVSTTVNAPAALVFRTIRNTDTWKDWNRFIPKVTIKKQPAEDDATNAEFANLVILNTSRALSVDSEIEKSFPPQTTNRRMSQQSGKSDSNKASVEQQFHEMTQGRRGSYASTKSNPSNNNNDSTNLAPPKPTTSTLNSTEVAVPQNESLFSSPAPAGGLIPAPPASPFTSNVSPQASRKGSIVAPGPLVPQAGKRKLSITSIYGELSVRLIVGTQLVLHTRPKIPQYLNSFRDIPIIVTEVSRPPDPLNPDEFPPGQSLQKSKTHTTSKSGIYRIVWGSDSSRPKFMLQFQRVWEIRPQFSGAGAAMEESCELSMWECAKGMSVKGTLGEKGYLQTRFAETVEGLKGFCESLGGKGVERRDFSVG